MEFILWNTFNRGVEFTDELKDYFKFAVRNGLAGKKIHKIFDSYPMPKKYDDIFLYKLMPFFDEEIDDLKVSLEKPAEIGMIELVEYKNALRDILCSIDWS